MLFVISNVSTWPVSPTPGSIAVAQPLAVCAPASSLTVWSAPFVKLGALLIPETVIRKVCVADWFTPPSAVPPLSSSRSVIVAAPLASAAGVNVRSPFDATAGAALKSAALVLFVTTKVSVCADSLAGPALIAVAQPVWLNAPLFSSTVTSAPLVKPARRSPW